MNDARRMQWLAALTALGDAVVLGGCLVGAVALRFGGAWPAPNVPPLLRVAIAALIAWGALGALYGLYDVRRLPPASAVRTVVAAHAGFTIGLGFLVGPVDVPRSVVLLLAGLEIPALLGWRAVWRRLLSRWGLPGRVLLVGHPPLDRSVLRATWPRATADPTHPAHLPPTWTDVAAVLIGPDVPPAARLPWFLACLAADCPCYWVPTGSDRALAQAHLTVLARQPVLTPAPWHGAAAWRRLVDRSLAGAALVLLGPLWWLWRRHQALQDWQAVFAGDRAGISPERPAAPPCPPAGPPAPGPRRRPRRGAARSARRHPLGIPGLPGSRSATHDPVPGGPGARRHTPTAKE